MTRTARRVEASIVRGRSAHSASPGNDDLDARRRRTRPRRARSGTARRVRARERGREIDESLGHHRGARLAGARAPARQRGRRDRVPRRCRAVEDLLGPRTGRSGRGGRAKMPRPTWGGRVGHGSVPEESRRASTALAVRPSQRVVTGRLKGVTCASIIHATSAHVAGAECDAVRHHRPSWCVP